MHYAKELVAFFSSSHATVSVTTYGGNALHVTDRVNDREGCHSEDVVAEFIRYAKVSIIGDLLVCFVTTNGARVASWCHVRLTTTGRQMLCFDPAEGEMSVVKSANALRSLKKTRAEQFPVYKCGGEQVGLASLS